MRTIAARPHRRRRPRRRDCPAGPRASAGIPRWPRRSTRSTSRPARRIGRLALSFKSLLADVYWIRAVQYFGGTRLDEAARCRRPAAAAPATTCCTRCSTWRRRSIPSFNIAYRFGAIFLAEGYPERAGPPGSGRHAARQGLCEQPDASGSTSTTRPLSTTGRSATTGRPRTGSREAAQGAGLAGVDARPGGVHAGAGRRSPQLALPVAADAATPPSSSTCAKTRSSICGSSTSLDVADQLTTLLERYVAQTGDHAPTSFEPLIRAGWLRGVPDRSRRRALHDRSRRRSGDARSAIEVRAPARGGHASAARVRSAAGRRRDERSDVCRRCSASSGCSSGSFLNVCIYRLPTARERCSGDARTAPTAGARSARGRTSRSSAGCRSAAAAPAARRLSRCSTRSSSWRPALVFAAGAWLVRADAAARVRA